MAFVPTGMNCGVSTTPWVSVRRPARARVEPSAGGGVVDVVTRGGAHERAGRHASSASSASGRVRLGSDGREVPQAGLPGLGAARRRDLVAEPGQVRPREVGGDAALRRPVDEAEAQQERLVDVLDGLDLLGQDGGEGRATPTGPDANFWTIAASSLRSVESRPSSSISIARMAAVAVCLVDVAVAVDLGVVADALEQSVDDARRAPAAPGDGLGRRRVDGHVEDRAPSGRRSPRARVPCRSRAGRSPRTGRATGC